MKIQHVAGKSVAGKSARSKPAATAAAKLARASEWRKLVAGTQCTRSGGIRLVLKLVQLLLAAHEPGVQTTCRDPYLTKIWSCLRYGGGCGI